MEDDYKTRMVEEFHELKDRINKINDIIEKYNNGQRGHITVREASLMMAQSYIMQDYALVLFDRLTVAGINPESDDVEPEEKPLPPEPQSHGLFIPRDGEPYLVLHDMDGTWSYVVNTPSIMCRINGWSELASTINMLSGYLNWEQLVKNLQDSAFPLIPLEASSMPTIAKALADSK
ncbi:crAss001_48 related protein [Bifidobacterium adolescentis]|jgi:hypothetical protein|uniref:Uncharacterized protein n=1 Tax=Bifidobacterium adolescentis TaxID=1680 RepID=A0AAF0VF77_BIFAD|nr:hypothetical protein [Bifidobacterium adolescentis]WNE86117.1 hypothetical protein B0703_04230 [Bifidobacterium adolescentis]